MENNQNPPETGPVPLVMPLANACASLMTDELAAALKFLPTKRDKCGRFEPLYVPGNARLFSFLSGLASMGLAVVDGNHFRLSSAGSFVREALEEYGPGGDDNRAAELVDNVLPNLDAVSRERAVSMATALLEHVGREAAIINLRTRP